MGLFDSKVKKFEQKIGEFLSSSKSQLYPLRFQKLSERDFCSFTCDSLSGIFLRAFGGDYESSITFRFSEKAGLCAEVYVSDARARQAGSAIKTAVKEEASKFSETYCTDSRISVSFTPYSPGSTSLTFELISFDYHTMDELEYTLGRMAIVIKKVAERF